MSPIRDRGEIERAFEAFARRANGRGGLIVTAAAGAVAHQNLIMSLAARHKLPAVYFQSYFVAGGGLMSYGSDLFDQYRGAAGYVDRILRGQKAADLPVQAPTKDVRRECRQFSRVMADVIGVSPGPADVEADIASVGPS